MSYCPVLCRTGTTTLSFQLKTIDTFLGESGPGCGKSSRSSVEGSEKLSLYWLGLG